MRGESRNREQGEFPPLPRGLCLASHRRGMWFSRHNSLPKRCGQSFMGPDENLTAIQRFVLGPSIGSCSSLPTAGGKPAQRRMENAALSTHDASPGEYVTPACNGRRSVGVASGGQNTTNGQRETFLAPSLLSRGAHHGWGGRRMTYCNLSAKCPM